MRNSVSRTKIRTAIGIPMLFLAGCGSVPPPSGGPVSDAAQLVSRSGKVAMPAGAAWVITDFQVVNATGRTMVGTNGMFTLNTLPDGEQLAAVYNPDGVLMMLGWLGEQRSEISARTTAEVLVYFALGCYTFPDEIHPRILDALSYAAELDGFAAALEAGLADDSAVLSHENPELAAAARQAVDDLLAGAGASATDFRRMMLIQPSEERSGIRVEHTSAINTLRIVNNYRRRAFVIIEQQSYKRESDGATITEIAEHPATDFWLAPVNGIGEGVLDTVTDIFMGMFNAGTMAYEPVMTDPIEMPLRDASSQTTYAVKILGPGLSAGDTADLTEEEREQLYIAWAASLGLDVVLPAVSNVILPIRNYGGFTDIVTPPNRYDYYEDLINAVKDAPGFIEAMERGQTAAALTILWEQLTLEQTSLRSATLYALGWVVTLLEEAGKIPEGALTQYAEGMSMAGHILNALTLLDLGFGIGDLGVTLAHIGESNQADIWTVDVLPPNVTLEPAEHEFCLGWTWPLVASVPAATGSAGDAPAFVYHWSTTGTRGFLFDDIGHEGTAFDSSLNQVSYRATSTEEGTDTVTVEVFQIAGSDRIPVGSASSEMHVLAEDGATISFNKTSVGPEVVVLEEPVRPATGGRPLLQVVRRRCGRNLDRATPAPRTWPDRAIKARGSTSRTRESTWTATTNLAFSNAWAWTRTTPTPTIPYGWK